MITGNINIIISINLIITVIIINISIIIKIIFDFANIMSMICVILIDCFLGKKLNFRLFQLHNNGNRNQDYFIRYNHLLLGET